MYIKRVFEANSDENSDFTTCKTIVETLGDFEDEVEVKYYKEGYYDKGYDSLERSSRGDDSKKSIRFSLGVKEFNGIESKAGFDKTILLLQRSKTLFGKFAHYCKNTIVNVKGDNDVEFTLPFDHDDDNEKVASRLSRMRTVIWEYFNDGTRSYEDNKTFYISKERPKKDWYKPHEYTAEQVRPILEEIKRKGKESYGRKYDKDVINPATYILDDTSQKPAFSGPRIEFRFGMKMDVEGNNIILTPNTYRWKTYDIPWKNLKATSEVDNNVVELVIAKLKSNYHFKKDDVQRVEFKVENGKGVISIK